mgnify:CR=1 FL=1
MYRLAASGRSAYDLAPFVGADQPGHDQQRCKGGDPASRQFETVGLDGDASRSREVELPEDAVE